MLVDEGSASASEIVTGALQDRKRAKVVGTRTYGKGVFQEIERLANGGALDITVGEYFTPSGRNLGGGGVRKGAGITPDIKASDDPKTEPRRGAARRRCRRSPGEPSAFSRSTAATSRSRRSSSAGTAINVDKPRRGERVGDLVQVAPGRGGRARIVRRIGRPDVARDVLDALMVAARAAAALRPAGRARGPRMPPRRSPPAASGATCGR